MFVLISQFAFGFWKLCLVKIGIEIGSATKRCHPQRFYRRRQARWCFRLKWTSIQSMAKRCWKWSPKWKSTATTAHSNWPWVYRGSRAKTSMYLPGTGRLLWKPLTRLAWRISTFAKCTKPTTLFRQALWWTNYANHIKTMCCAFAAKSKNQRHAPSSDAVYEKYEIEL